MSGGRVLRSEEQRMNQYLLSVYEVEGQVDGAPVS